MPKTQTNPLEEAAERALRRLERMTPEELIQTVKDAGILTPDGRLAPEYGGDAAGEDGQDVARADEAVRRAG